MALGLLIGAYLLIFVIVVMYERCLRFSRSAQAEPRLSEAPQYEQLGLFPPSTTGGTDYPTEPEIDPEQFKAMFLNEDEEDIKHMLESGAIVKEQIPEVLDALGISNEVHFT